MTQEQSHPDQEGDTDNRRRRQSGQVTQQGALLSGRPAGLPTRTAARSAPALIGVTADEHWVIRHGPTYALLLIANQRPAAPSPLWSGPTPGRRELGRGAETFPARIPQEETAGNARHMRGAGAGRRARRPSGPEDGPEAHPGCRPASTTQSAARRPSREARRPPGWPARPTLGVCQAAPTRAPQASLGPPAGLPGAARRPPCRSPWSHPQAIRGTASRPTRGTFAGPAGAPAHPPGRPRRPSRGRRMHSPAARAGPAGGAVRRPTLTPAGGHAPGAGPAG